MDRWNCSRLVLVPHGHCPGSAVGYRWSGHHSFWLTNWQLDRIINTYTQQLGATNEQTTNSTDPRSNSSHSTGK